MGQSQSAAPPVAAPAADVGSSRRPSSSLRSATSRSPSSCSTSTIVESSPDSSPSASVPVPFSTGGVAHDAQSAARRRFGGLGTRFRKARTQSAPIIRSYVPRNPDEATQDVPEGDGNASKDKSHDERPSLRHSLSEVRLPPTEEPTESPIALVPLDEEPSAPVTGQPGAMDVQPEASGSQASTASAEVRRPSLDPFAGPSAPARRIVVTGTVTNLPNMSNHRTLLGHPPAAPVAHSTSTPTPSAEGSPSGLPDHESSQAPAAPVTPSPAVDANNEHSMLISRLLCVAAAATAASLLPGRIHINGQLIEGFADAHGILSVPPGGGPSATPSDSAVHPSASPRTPSWRDRLRTRPRSTSWAPHTRVPSDEQRTPPTSRSVPSSPLSPLQNILRQALAAEFGSQAPEVRRSDEVDPERDSRPSAFGESPVGLTEEPTPASHEEAHAIPVTTLFVSSPTPSPRATLEGLPEDSFERFLWDLQVDVASAIRRTLREEADLVNTETSEASHDEFLLLSQAAAAVTTRESRAQRAGRPTSSSASQPTFTFFRSYRWPDHLLTHDGVLSELPAAGQEGSMPSESSASDESVAASATAPPSTAPTTPDPENATSDNPSPPINVSPVLLVGVRTVDASPAAASASPPAGEGAGDVGAAHSIAETSSELPSLAARGRSPSTHPGAATSDGTQRTWMIWIAGGIYPPSHPLLAFPALLSGFDQAATYEELLRLAEIMGGQQKPPVASQAEIDASDLRVVKGSELRQLTSEGDVLANTSERCLICLEDWTPADEARILKCHHAFHRGCVDRWLATSNNSCPCCRKQAVVSGPGDSERAQTSGSSVSTTA